MRSIFKPTIPAKDGEKDELAQFLKSVVQGDYLFLKQQL